MTGHVRVHMKRGARLARASSNEDERFLSVLTGSATTAATSHALCQKFRTRLKPCDTDRVGSVFVVLSYLIHTLNSCSDDGEPILFHQNRMISRFATHPKTPKANCSLRFDIFSRQSVERSLQEFACWRTKINCAEYLDHPTVEKFL